MQIVGYKWKNNDGWGPSIILNEGGKAKFYGIMDKHVFLKVGKSFCTGYFSNGKRVDCPEKKILLSGKNCNSCQEKDPYFKCMKCIGECINEKNRENCKNTEYFMYFTTFGPLLKVGISQQYRFFERMIEQGAELGIKFSKIKDGKEVRIIEQKIKKFLDCEDRIYGKDKEEHIFGDPNNVILRVRDALNKLKDNGYSMINTEIYDFRKYYRLDRVRKKPRNFPIEDNTCIEGNVVACKGNILVIENSNQYYTINIHRLVSREVIEFSVGKEVLSNI